MSITVSVLRGGSNNHETTSEEANAVYTDFVSEGIVGSIANTSGIAPATGGFAVNAQGSPNMTVAVSAGVAYVNGTPSSQNAQTFRIKNSASENVTISANTSGSTKYDWIYVKLDATNLNEPNTAGTNVGTLVTSRSSSASSDDGTPPTYGYPIAVVTVANAASSITNSVIRDVRTQVALNTGTSNASDGWTALTTPLTTVTGYNKGNKEFELTTGSSLVSVLSPGARLKVTRAITPPTQCLDLEASSSQYGSKSSPAGMTFTDDFTAEAWVNPESYTANACIVGRDSGSNGWGLRLNVSGQIEMYGQSSSNYRIAYSYVSVPLGVWTHVAATLDMSGSVATIYINGVSVDVAYTVSSPPSSITQGGDLQIGKNATASNYFDGKITDVRIWSAVRTATQIRDNMCQQIVGNETNLAAYFKLDGNLNDSTSNANNLTGSGGAAATTTDNPMKATEYAIVTKVTASIVTVFAGTDHAIPNITLSTPHYSTQKAPFGFPASQNKWRLVSYINHAYLGIAIAAVDQWSSSNFALSIPTGDWKIGYDGNFNLASTVSGSRDGVLAMASSTELTDNVRKNNSIISWLYGTASATDLVFHVYNTDVRTITTQTVYRMYAMIDSASGTETWQIRGEQGMTEMFAECAYA